MKLVTFKKKIAMSEWTLNFKNKSVCSCFGMINALGF